MNIIEATKSAIRYEPETGLFWNIRFRRYYDFKSKRGQINIPKYRMHTAARVAWMIMMGEEPKGVIDHIDGDPTNDKWENLQCISQSDNTHRYYRNKSVRGISYYPKCKTKPWYAYLKDKGAIILSEFFTTEEEAIQARRSKQEEFGILNIK